MNRFALITAVVALCPAAGFAAQSSSQTANGTIIWSAPAAAGAGKSDPIIWNDAPAAQPSSKGAPYKNGIVWNDPPTNSAPQATAQAAPRTEAARTEGPCREFQQNIIIDGRRVPAHGTACRQPDGTWRVVDR